MPLTMSSLYHHLKLCTNATLAYCGLLSLRDRALQCISDASGDVQGASDASSSLMFFSVEGSLNCPTLWWHIHCSCPLLQVMSVSFNIQNSRYYSRPAHTEVVRKSSHQSVPSKGFTSIQEALQKQCWSRKLPAVSLSPGLMLVSVLSCAVNTAGAV